jgi:type IV pilus assembly protein PilW
MQMRGTGGVKYWSDGVMSKNAQSYSLPAKQLLSPPLVGATAHNSPPLVGGARGGGKGEARTLFSSPLVACPPQEERDKREGARGRGFSACGTGLVSVRSGAGFTLIELLVAMALGMVILAGLFRTFKVQHDSYVIQDQVSAMQQNLRAAMYMITRDLQMAGYYSNFDRNNRQLDWNDDGTNENGRPLLFAVNNSTATGIKPQSDVIVIVKAGSEGRALAGGEGASAGVISLTNGAKPRDFDGDGIDDLNSTGKKFGLLVKQDLSFADFFHVDSATGNIDASGDLVENYTSGDLVFRADVIIYRVDNSDPAHPRLVRRNLGNDNNYQVIAENIDNLQFRYLYKDGVTWTNDPAIDPSGKAQQPRDVRAVEVLLVARTAYAQRGYRDTTSIPFGDYTIPAPNDAYRRKMLTSIVKTRNIGL